MNVNPDAPQGDEGEAAAAASSPEAAVDATGATEAVKPVRRKRAVKAAAGALATEPAGADVAPVDAGAATAPAPVLEASESGEPAPKAPRRKRAAAAPDAAATVVQETLFPGAELPAVAVREAPVLEAAAPPDGAEPATRADGAVDASPVVEAADGEPRSRRRGRRERRRGGRDDGDAAATAVAGSQAEFDTDEGDTEAETEAEAEADAAPSGPPPVPADVGEVFAQVLSGEFDVEVEPPAEPADAAAQPPKRVLRPEPEAPKLHKVLAQAGIGSRRDMEELILDGHITVNNQPAHIGQRISFGDQIKVNGKPVRVRIMPLPPRIIAYHKPVGEVVTNDDPQARPTVFRRLPRLQQGKWQSVGRLDMNTEGLLLFTNSGELANRLMHPRFGVEREYAVRVLGTLDSADKAQLIEGVPIDGQACSFRSIEDGGGEGANHWYRVVITEGRNREVRKLFEAVDLTVSRLIRIRYGCIVLPRGLKRGVWVDLEDGDVRAIRQLTAGAGDGQGGGQNGHPNGGRDGRDNGRDNTRDNAPRGRNNKNEPRRNAGPNEQTPRRNERGQGNGGPNGGAPDAPRQNPQRQHAAPQAVREFEGRADVDIDDDFDPSRIPNPLEQTFDKRFVQNPRTPAGGRGFRSGGGGFGAGGSAPAPAPKQRGNGPREPDPMQTSVGYIGGDAFHRKGNRGGNGGGQGGGNRGGGGGNRGNGGGQGGGQGGGGFGGNRRGR